MDVSGLEISQSKLRAIKLAFKGKVLTVAKIAEVDLPAGVFLEGKLVDKVQFENILANFLRKNHFSSNRWVVSLPGRRIFVTYKKFPNIPAEDLTSAVEMNIGTILPGNIEDISWGYQEITPLDKSSGKEVMVASISQNDLSDYLAAFSRTGIVPIAVEPKLLSTARVLSQAENTLVLNLEKLILTSTVVSFGYPRFSREATLSADEKEQFKSLISEVKRVINYYLTEQKGAQIDAIVLDGPQASQEIAKALSAELNKEVKLASDLFKVQNIKMPTLALYGLGLRALTDPSQDTNLSLLPVGSREAYEERRTLIFYGGISNIVVITSILILLVFILSVVFLTYLGDKTQKQMTNINSSSTGADPALVEEITSLNNKMATEAQLEAKTQDWSIVLNKIFTSVPQGVTIQDIEYNSADQPVVLTGQAQSRDALSTFNQNLTGLTELDSVQLTRSDFDVSKTVDFTMQIKVKAEALSS